MGDTLVPSSSPVVDPNYWQTLGALLALALLAGDNLHPVSPVLVYAIMSNVRERADPSAPMDLSLRLIQQLNNDKASILLPWMIIPPGQDPSSLPAGHRNLLTTLVVGLGFEAVGF